MSLPAKYDHLTGIQEIHNFFISECQENGKAELVDEFFTEDYIQHTPDPGQATDRSGARQSTVDFKQAIPDMKVEIVEQVVGGDKIANYKIFSGTHTGEGLGIPPTGEKVAFHVMDIVRYRDR